MIDRSLEVFKINTLFCFSFLGWLKRLVYDSAFKTIKKVLVPKIASGVKSLFNCIIKWVRSVDPVSSLTDI